MKKMLSKLFLGVMLFSMVGQAYAVGPACRKWYAISSYIDRMLDEVPEQRQLYEGMRERICDACRYERKMGTYKYFRDRSLEEFTKSYGHLDPQANLSLWGRLEQSATSLLNTVLAQFNGLTSVQKGCVVAAGTALSAAALYKLAKFYNKRRLAKAAQS